jgi:hypothetical protein
MRTDTIVPPQAVAAMEAGQAGADAFRQWINAHTPETWVLAFDKASQAKATARAAGWQEGSDIAQQVLDYLAVHRPVLQ